MRWYLKSLKASLLCGANKVIFPIEEISVCTLYNLSENTVPMDLQDDNRYQVCTATIQTVQARAAVQQECKRELVCSEAAP